MAETIVCEMCTYISKNQMEYARTKANAVAHKEAHEKAALRVALVEPELYIEYYMIYYEIEYTKLYNEAYSKFKAEYLEILTIKHLISDDICSYYRENIMLRAK